MRWRRRAPPKKLARRSSGQIESGETPGVTNVQKTIAGVKKGTKNKTTKTASLGTKAEAGNNSISLIVAATGAEMSAERRKALHAASETDGDPADADSATSSSPGSSAAEQPTIESALSSAEFSLIEHWQLSTPEERQPVRDRVVAELLMDTDTLRDFLDRLGVDGLRKTMSPEFGAELRAAVPKWKKPKIEHYVPSARDAAGKPIWTRQERDRSRH